MLFLGNPAVGMLLRVQSVDEYLYIAATFGVMFWKPRRW